MRAATFVLNEVKHEVVHLKQKTRDPGQCFT
jgi:hypothetical protein